MPPYLKVDHNRFDKLLTSADQEGASFSIAPSSIHEQHGSRKWSEFNPGKLFAPTSESVYDEVPGKPLLDNCGHLRAT